MNDPLGTLLDQLERAVGADAGVALLIADTEDALQVRAASANLPSGDRTSWVTRLTSGLKGSRGRGADAASSQPATQLLLGVPDGRGSVLAMLRRTDEPFGAQDRALARLYARQLAAELSPVGVVPGPIGPRAVGTAVGPDTTQAPPGSAQAGPPAGAVLAWTQDLRAVRSIAAQLTRLATADRIGAVICSETRRVVPADSCRVYVLARDGVTLEAVAWAHHAPEYATEDADSLRVRVGTGIIGSAVEAGESVIVSDASRHPAAIPVPGTTLVEEAMLVVPLRYEGMPRGAIVLSRLGRTGFGQDELRLVQVLADQAVVAFENARSLADRDRAVQELEALLRISSAGSAEHDEGTLSELVARTVHKVVGVDAVVVSRLDEASPRLDILATAGTLPGTVDRSGVDLMASRTTRQVLLQGRPQLLEARGARADALDAVMLRRLGARQGVLVPLVAAGRTTGLLELYLVAEDRSLTDHELDLIRTMAGQAAASLQGVRLLAQLREAADVDQLTGVHNHRYLQERLAQEVARSSRSRAPLSVMLVDLDGFKTINDQHGHADGDRVLRNVAATLRMAVRAHDIVARYGGDEFVIVMPDTGLEAARLVADRVVGSVRGLRHQLSDGSEGRVACSAGLAVAPDDGRTAARLLRAADAAMYRAKRGGGDAVSRAEPVRGAPATARPASA